MSIHFNKIKNPWTALAGLSMVLLATIRHSVLVYISVTHQSPEPLTYVYAAAMLLSLEFAVVIFSVHGQRKASWTFAILIGVLNLYYFWADMTYPSQIQAVTILPFLPGMIYSSLFAASLAYFAETFSSYIEADNRLMKLGEELQAWKEKAKVQGEQLRSLKATQSKGVEESEEYQRLLGENKRMAEEVGRMAEEIHGFATWMAIEQKLNESTTDAIRQQEKYYREKVDSETDPAKKAYARLRWYAALTKKQSHNGHQQSHH